MTFATVTFGFAVLWLILELTARLLGSFSGEAGLVVALVVVAAAVSIEAFRTGSPVFVAAAGLGLRRPGRRGLLASIALGAALLAYFPLFALATEATIILRPDWYLLLPGLFAQAGVAEETVFRGFLFGHLRQGRSFWRAAGLSAIPFTAAHLLLFATLDFAVALVAVIVSVSLSFPLAWLFERSGYSIWPPAIVHFVVQGSIKLVEVGGDKFPSLAIGWMIVSALSPWLFFLMRPEPPDKA